MRTIIEAKVEKIETKLDFHDRELPSSIEAMREIFL